MSFVTVMRRLGLDRLEPRAPPEDDEAISVGMGAGERTTWSGAEGELPFP